MSDLSVVAPVAVVVSEMLETIAYASIAGIGISVIFSVAIFGATKSVDLTQEGRRGAALGSAVLAFVAVAVCLAAVGFGIVMMIVD